MRDAILSPFLQTSVMITYILLPQPPSPPPSAADTHIFLNDIIRASTHNKISDQTLYIAGISAPSKAAKLLEPQARHFTTFHQYSASLLLLTYHEWHQVALLY